MKNFLDSIFEWNVIDIISKIKRYGNLMFCKSFEIQKVKRKTRYAD